MSDKPDFLKSSSEKNGPPKVGTPEPSSTLFRNAETIERLPPVEKPAETAVAKPPAGNATTVTEPLADKKKASWVLVAAIAGAAAFGGYLVGTTGHKDQFGSRPGDITLAPGAAKPVTAPPVVAPVTPPPTPANQTAQPETPPAGSPPATEPKPPDSGAVPTQKTTGIAPTPPAKPSLAAAAANKAAAKKKPPQEPEDLRAYTIVHTPPAPEKPPVLAERPAPPPPPEPAPAPVAKKPVIPKATSTVSIEPINGGGFKKAVGSIFGRTRDENFTPAQAVKSFAPNVPGDLARQLTGPVLVNLRLKVDRTGAVSSVDILSKGVPEAFVRLAGDAAYDWQFEPARLKDKPVPSDVLAHFHFTPGS